MNIGNYIREIRQSRSLTLQDVAAASGLSTSYLSDIERGRTEPSFESLRKIAAAFHLNLRIDFVNPATNEAVSERLFRDSVRTIHDAMTELLETWA